MPHGPVFSQIQPVNLINRVISNPHSNLRSLDYTQLRRLQHTNPHLARCNEILQPLLQGLDGKEKGEEVVAVRDCGEEAWVLASRVVFGCVLVELREEGFGG